jgi:hypothetical protein
MPIVLNGTTGITTPTYNGNTTAEYLVPVTAFKNRIINGAMVINQRGFSGSNSNNTYTLDRWVMGTDLDNKFTLSQSSTAPVGFNNSLFVTSSSAYSVPAGGFYRITQFIEGYNIADLNWGTANAKTVTLSFWVRSSLTGTFGGSLYNSDGSRSYPFTYTISSANTWEQKSVTIAGDTSGTWQTTTSSGVAVNFSMAMGSNYLGPAGAWASALYVSATGSTNILATNGATWYVTGVQLEVGSTATSFDYRPYGTELQLCQRYYQTTGSITGVGANSTTFQGFVTYAVQMRIVNPVFALNAVMRITDGFAANHTMSSLSGGYSINQSSPNLQYVQFNNFSGLTQGRFYGSYANANTDAATLSAEL